MRLSGLEADRGNQSLRSGRENTNPSVHSHSLSDRHRRRLRNARDLRQAEREATHPTYSGTALHSTDGNNGSAFSIACGQTMRSAKKERQGRTSQLSAGGVRKLPSSPYPWRNSRSTSVELAVPQHHPVSKRKQSHNASTVSNPRADSGTTDIANNYMMSDTLDPSLLQPQSKRVSEPPKTFNKPPTSSFQNALSDIDGASLNSSTLVNANPKAAANLRMLRIPNKTST